MKHFWDFSFVLWILLRMIIRRNTDFAAVGISLTTFPADIYAAGNSAGYIYFVLIFLRNYYWILFLCFLRKFRKYCCGFYCEFSCGLSCGLFLLFFFSFFIEFVWFYIPGSIYVSEDFMKLVLGNTLGGLGFDPRKLKFLTTNMCLSKNRGKIPAKWSSKERTWCQRYNKCCSYQICLIFKKSFSAHLWPHA